MYLIIFPHNFAIGVNQISAVIIANPLPSLAERRASKKKIDFAGVNYLQCLSCEVLVVQKVKRKGCLRPDYEIRATLQGSNRQGAIALEGLMLKRRKPLFGLVNISLHQGNSTLRRGLSSPVDLS